MFRVVPFFLGVGLSREHEAVAKYFIIQAVGSVLFLLGGLFNYFYWGSVFVGYGSCANVSCFLICLGLMVKMGLVPFHFWIPRVMGGLR